MIWGRKNELSVLQNSFNSKQSQIIAIYGRRRIGKSYLVDAFCKNKSADWIDVLDKLTAILRLPRKEKMTD